MQTESGIEECPKCGAAMQFVCFINNETGKEISAKIVGKDGKPEGPPPGALKKYQCPNDGHEETRG